MESHTSQMKKVNTKELIPNLFDLLKKQIFTNPEQLKPLSTKDTGSETRTPPDEPDVKLEENTDYIDRQIFKMLEQKIAENA